MITCPFMSDKTQQPCSNSCALYVNGKCAFKFLSETVAKADTSNKIIVDELRAINYVLRKK